MPELPEVETIRRQLEKLIVGRTISSIEVLNKGSFRAKAESFIGKSVTDIGRKGKVLTLDLKRSDLGRSQGRTLRSLRNRKDFHLYIHLKMSGQLEFFDGIKRSNLAAARLDLKKFKGKHLRVVIGFTDNSQLLFHDQRKFGWITDDPAAPPTGIDALDPALSSKKLTQILISSSRPVKQILLDQSKIAGIGNIYASEILWEAKMNPATKGLTFCARSGVLLAAVRKVLTEAIESGGSTMADGLYQHIGGESGSYWSRRRVYDRAGELCHRPACKRKGDVIRKITVGQRSTYFCPACQRLKA